MRFIAALTILLLAATPLCAAEPVQVLITGIDGEALSNVKEALRLPPGLMRDGPLEPLWLKRFEKQAPQKVRSALEPFGYYHATVSATIDPTEYGYRLKVTVVPGEPVRITNVRVQLTGPGSGAARIKAAVAAFPLKSGDQLLHHQYETGRERLRSAAVDFGYLKADFTRREIRIHPGEITAEIELVLDTGERYTFGPTTITGGEDYPDPFLRRHLAYREGRPFSYPLLGETQQNLVNSERFKDVIVTAAPDESVELRVPVNLRLSPAPRITLRPGIGYGTDTGARFTLNYRDLNVWHRGHELFSNLFLAEHLQGLASGYIWPNPKDVKSATSLRINLQQEDNSDYDSRIAALTAERSRSTGRREQIAFYLTAQHEEYTVGNQTSSSFFLLPGIRYAKDRFDDPIRPRQGYRIGLHLRGTDEALGSDTQLLQLLTEGGYLLPLPGKFSLRSRANVGMTLLSNSLKNIPASLRFFAGGDQSVRGYAYRSLGPVDDSGKVTGGKHLLSGSLELERELWRNTGLSIFYDVGNSFDSFSSFTLHHGAGVTLHYYTPVGSLNLSLARTLRADNPTYRIHFTLGFDL
jgi:translocation and assembly module TamA